MVCSSTCVADKVIQLTLALPVHVSFRGVIAGILEAPDFLRVTGNPSSDYIGFITSSMLLGAFVATVPAGEPPSESY